jgi:probable DNA metabolism protein
MNLYTYDGTFGGLLTVVFESYERKETPVSIEQDILAQPTMFGEIVSVTTDVVKAGRVWKGLQKRLSADAQQAIYYTFLWEQPGFEMLVYDFIRLAIDSKENIEGDFTASCVLQLQQVKKQVHREKHRMEAFVRFQKAKDGLFYASVSPDFNVLPLIKKHFEKRYADQRWAIYDTKRHYGIYYDLVSTSLINLDNLPQRQKGVLQASAFDVEEEDYQQLWQVYFDHVNIVERKNPKLHLRHVPKRYWKYLSEKQPRFLKP